MAEMFKRILRAADAATYLGLAPVTMEKMRVTGEGPKFIMLTGRAIGYDIRDLDEWVDKRKRQSTSASSKA
jgi:predicted DNA-binding transcriptional regulator AlpA